MEIDKMPIWIRVQNLHITRWIVIEEQLTKINLGSKKNLQHVKISVDLEYVINYQLIKSLKDFKDVFAATYKNLKGIPLDIAQHWIELDTSIPHAHQVSYW
jgi:hypothetical protein